MGAVEPSAQPSDRIRNETWEYFGARLVRKEESDYGWPVGQV